MKTKNKMIVLLEIAIVLCSLFLVAIPVIAADQNQEMQEVSASRVTTASEDDYVLGVYGNANEDDTIDMGDVVYTKLAIFGKKPKTELCDAKYDGRINVLDVIQTKLIILGKERELTIIDSIDRIVTLDMPIERVVVTEDKIGEAIRILGVEDKVVGIDPNIAKVGYFPVMADKPHVGSAYGPLDYEVIAELHPDLVLLIDYHSGHIGKLKEMGIPAICVSTYIFPWKKDVEPEPEPIDGRDIDLTADKQVHCFRILGTIFNRDEKARKFLDWRTNLLEMIKDRTEGIEENDELDAWFGSTSDGRYNAIGKGYKSSAIVDIAGLHNIAEFPGSRIVDPEWVVINNPDIFFFCGRPSHSHGYQMTNPSELEEIIKRVMESTILSQTTAIKTGHVYVLASICADVRPWIGAVYMGKVAYPERFEGIDPDEVSREYFERWLRVPYQGIHFWPRPWV